MASTLTTACHPPRLPRYLQSVLYLRFREWFLPAMHRKYGDVFSLAVPHTTTRTRPEHQRSSRADLRSLHAAKATTSLVLSWRALGIDDRRSRTRGMRSLLMPAFTSRASGAAAT